MNTVSQAVEAPDRATINVKRTTLMAALTIIIIVLAALSAIALYASRLALQAANNVDAQWQQQHTRILDIEVKAVQANSSASMTKEQQKAIQHQLMALRKELQAVSHRLAQANSYQATRESMEAERAAEEDRIIEAQAALAKENTELEKKGVNNFDRVLMERLRGVWVRPAVLTPGAVVEIQITFAQDGTITNAVTAKSSGDPAADRSVLKAAADLSHIPEMVTVHPAIYQKYLQQRVISFNLK